MKIKSNLYITGKQVIRIVGGVTAICLGCKIIYESGRQSGVTLTERFVEYYEPESHKRLTEIFKKHN